MSSILNMVAEYGFVFVFTLVVIYFLFKYGDKFLKITIDRMENKNYMIDILTKSLENCNQVIEHNTKALENNSVVIKNYTDNAYKLEKRIDNLVNDLKERDYISSEILTEVKILKDRK